MFRIVVNDRYEPRDIKNFNGFSLTLSHDSLSDTFGFSWMFDPDNYDHKELLCLGHFHECDVYYDNELLVTGNIINNTFVSSSVRELAQIGGYSRTGVLEDSTVPISSYPLQTQGLTIEQVARKLCEPYNITIKIDDSVKSKMKSIVTNDNIEPTETIKSYLQKITDVKRIIISHTNKGELLFTEAKVNQRPLFEFDRSGGSIPGYKFTHNFNGQNMHRNITVVQQASDSGTTGGQHTIRNPYVVGSYPKDKTVTIGEGIADDIKMAARQELAKELQNISITIEMSNWKIGDELILPNNIVSIFDPNLYIYKKVDWFIKSVSYVGDSTGVTCTMQCVLPEVFTNKEVVSIFKGINVHSRNND